MRCSTPITPLSFSIVCVHLILLAAVNSRTFCGVSFASIPTISKPRA